MTASIPGGLSGAATGAERATASSPEQAPQERARPEPPGLEQRIARLLTIGTWAAVGLLVLGLVLMLASGIAPLSGGPAFDPSRLPGDLVALRPAGFIWLGLLVVVGTPSARVVASLVGYARRGESRMAVVAVLILVVIGASVALAKGLQG